MQKQSKISKKRLKVDAKPIHKSRFVYNTCKNRNELHVSSHQWKHWYSSFKLVNTFASHTKTYAQVVKKGSKSDKSVHLNQTGPTFSSKTVALNPMRTTQIQSCKKSNACSRALNATKRTWSQNASTQNCYEPVSTANRFQVLTNYCHEQTNNEPECSNVNTDIHITESKKRNNARVKYQPESTVPILATSLEGNKNKNRLKLGSGTSSAETEADNLETKPLEGNKNETGQTLGYHQHTQQNNNSQSIQMIEVSENNEIDTDTIQTFTRKKNIPENVKLQKIHSKHYNASVRQNFQRFGFLPYNDLMVYNGHDIVWGNVPDIIAAHSMIRQSNVPNFMGCRIPLKTQLNIEAWQKYLDSYWDEQLIDLLKFGYPLDFDRNRNLTSTLQNHKSAIEFKDHVDAYIQKELEYEAILGPFQYPPFPCHVSPFLTRHKPNSDNRRVILDLSFPPNESVNDGVKRDQYLGTYFDLTYPSVDTLVKNSKTGCTHF